MIRGATGWMDAAACANRGNRNFFSDLTDQQNTALQFCDRCPVQQQCLDYALDGEERFGIWGGLTARQRAQMLNGRPIRSRCAECGAVYTTERGTSHRSMYCGPECRDTSHRRQDLARKYLEHKRCVVCGTNTTGNDICSAYCRFTYRRSTLRKTSDQ
jgi:WhiB family redox-sensing transcriptional regulator